MEDKLWFKSWPEDVPKTINYEHKKPIDYLQLMARRYPLRIAITTPSESLTYQELLTKVEKFSYGLNRLGLGKDDRIGISLTNCAEFAISFYATLNIGAIAVLIDPTDTPPTFKRKVSESEPEAIITHDYLFPKHKAVLKEKIAILVKRNNYFKTSSLFEDLIIKLKVWYTAFFEDPRTIVFFDEVIKSKPNFWDSNVKVHMDDTACVLYSVGSKGIRFSHHDLSIGAQQVTQWTKLTQKDSILSIFPLTKSFGLSFCLNLPLTIGSKSILMPSNNIKTVLKMIQKYRPTIFIGTSGIYEDLVNFPDLEKYNLSSFKHSFTIDKMAEEVQEKFEQKIGTRLIEAYALTETSTIQCSNLLTHGRQDSIGIPLPDVEMKIVDLDNYTKELPPNEIGEILIKSPSLMKGYWDPKESLRKIQKDWFLTGDVGKMDEDGFFYIFNKKWDIIKTDIGTILPKEVEGIINSHPAVLESAIVGIKHNEMHYIIAGIRLKNHVLLNPEEIIEHCSNNLKDYQVPDYVYFVDELARAENGRLARQKIKAVLRSKLTN